MIRRAQLVFCAAVVLAAVIVGTQLPLGQILGQRAAIARASAELRQLQAQNAALSAQVHALGQPANVGVIAHQQYGLVYPGQQSYVILPEPVEPGHTQSGPLSTVSIPASDLVPSDALVSATGAAPAPAPAAGGSGFLGQVLDRLEFWRWAF